MKLFFKPPSYALDENRVAKGEPGLEVEISSDHLTVGLTNAPPYLDKKLAYRIEVHKSSWSTYGDQLIVVLKKYKKGEDWNRVFDLYYY